MKYLTAILGLALCVASCSTNKTDEAAKSDEAAADSVKKVVVDGKWKLAEYTLNDSTIKVAGEDDYVLNLSTDSTFNMNTSCNNIGGKYVVNGDSIKFSDTFATRMMCPDMSVEDAMNTVFAQAQTVSVDNDSILNIANDGKTLASFVMVK